MKKSKIFRVISMAMAIFALVMCFGTTNALAAEVTNSPQLIAQASEIVEPKSGVETLPFGWYTISSSFSIDGYNYTPLKTVQGRYMKLNFSCEVAENSIGLRGVYVTIRIRDYNTKEFIPGASYSFLMDSNDSTYYIETSTFDLGYAGRNIQIYTQIQSLHALDPVTRTVNFTNYRSYVSN